MQYPYKLYKKNITGGGADVKGNAVAGNVQWVFVSECRDELSNGKKTPLVDGSAHDYTAKVFMPADCPEIDRGVEVQVRTEDGEVRIGKAVLLFDTGQYHCRLWL